MASPRNSPDTAKRALDAHEPPAASQPHLHTGHGNGNGDGDGDAVPTKRPKREHSSPTPTPTPPTGEADAQAPGTPCLSLGSRARTTHIAPRIGAMGKGVNDRRWALLPTKIIQRILTEAMYDAPMPRAMMQHWKGQTQYALAQVHCTRRWLGELRGMCHWWCEAIDSMSFWDGLYAAYGVSAPTHNFRSSIRPAPFHLARIFASRACMPCSIAYGALRPAHPDITIWSAFFGAVPVCVEHEENFCQDCFASSKDVSVCDDHDQDAEGAWRERDTFLCHACRLSALEAHLGRELECCARGGVVRGASNPWHDSMHYESYARGYGTAQGTTNQLLIMMAVRVLNPERYELYLALVEELHALDIKHREAYIQAQVRGWPHSYAEKQVHPQEDLARRREIHGVLQPYDTYSFNIDTTERVRYFVQWQADYNNGQLEEDPKELTPKYRRLLYYACIDGFIADRISSGIWVFPSVEISHLSSASASASANPPHEMIDGTLLDIARLVDSAQHPLGETRPAGGYWTLETSPACAVDNLRIAKRRNHPEQFLPPPSVLQHLDERFRMRLASTLAPALSRIVDVTWSLLGDVGPRRVETALSKWSFARVLEGLVGAETWSARELDRAPELVTPAPPTPTLSVKMGGRGTFTPASPRVELVAEEVESGPMVLVRDAVDEMDASVEVWRGGVGLPVSEEDGPESDLEVEVGRGAGVDGKHGSGPAAAAGAAEDKDEWMATYSDTEGSGSDPEELSLSDDELDTDEAGGGLVAGAGAGTGAGARHGGRGREHAGHSPQRGGTGPRLIVPWALVPSVPQLREGVKGAGAGAAATNCNGHGNGNANDDDNGNGNGMNGTNGTNATNGSGTNGTMEASEKDAGRARRSDESDLDSDSDSDSDNGISPDDDAGKMLAQELIMHLWFRARETLRVCRCRICERGRAVRAAMM